MNDPASTHRPCPVCSGGQQILVGQLEKTQKDLSGPRQYSLVHCNACELVYLDPLPSNEVFDQMYQTGRQFDGPANHGQVFEDGVSFLERRLNALLEAQKIIDLDCMKLLEIGAGVAPMARAAKNLNRKVLTVAQDLTAEAQDRCDWVDLYSVGSLDETFQLLESRGPYDVISMTHVLEHVPDPVRIMHFGRQLLARQGLFFITKPHRPRGWNVSSPIGLWTDWHLNHVPAHLQYFSKKSLQLAAAKTGLMIVFYREAMNGGTGLEAWLSRSAH